MNIKMMKKYDYFKKDIEYSFDSLTEVLNKNEIIGFVEWLINNNTPFTVGMVDVDNFKNLNDGFGHMVGDEVLVSIAKTLETAIINSGLVGRIGGDEFLVVLPEVTEYNDVWGFFHNINLLVGKLEFNRIDGLSTSVTTGIARYPMDGKNYSELYEKSDKALYRGKTKGRNCFIIYLAAKHANLMLKKESEPTFSFMEAINRIFEIAYIKDNIRDAIQTLLKYLIVYTNVDYIAVQNNSKIVASLYSPNCLNNKFEYIPAKYYEKSMNSMKLQYSNDVKTLIQSGDLQLYEKLHKQNIHAFFMMKISIGGTDYGTLIVNSSSSRVWKVHDMNAYILVAKVIANNLSLKKITLDD